MHGSAREYGAMRRHVWKCGAMRLSETGMGCQCNIAVAS